MSPYDAGGSGSYTCSWYDTNDGAATWTSGGATARFAPYVSGVPICGSSAATYTVLVTDTVRGKTAASNGAQYIYTTSRPAAAAATERIEAIEPTPPTRQSRPSPSGPIRA